jgi:hypothetical protein
MTCTLNLKSILWLIVVKKKHMVNDFYILVKNSGAGKDARRSPYGQKTPNRPGGYIHGSDTKLDS